MNIDIAWEAYIMFVSFALASAHGQTFDYKATHKSNFKEPVSRDVYHKAKLLLPIQYII